jgi:outer membrane protein OmpU
MRESQMKKIIALAVAGAFVAPVMAADVTISGDAIFALVDNKKTSATTNTINSESDFTIKASTETANGLSVSMDINMEADGTNDGGNSIDVAGAFGKIVIGDDSGALDSIDGKTDPYFVVDHNASDASVQNFNDAGVTWTLPSLASGVSVKVTYSPEDGGSGDAYVAEGIKSDMAGILVTYKNGPLFLGVASEETGTDSDQGIVATYSVAGVTVAYETFQNETGAAVKTNYNALGATYKTGDLTLAYSSVDEKESGGGDRLSDRTAYGVHYNLGGGVVVFLESSDESIETGNEEETAVGISMKF